MLSTSQRNSSSSRLVLKPLIVTRWNRNLQNENTNSPFLSLYISYSASVEKLVNLKEILVTVGLRAGFKFEFLNLNFSTMNFSTLNFSTF